MNSNFDSDQVSLGCATDQDLLRWDARSVIKAKTEAPQVRARSSKPKVSGERTLTYVASDETPDRVGDVIKVNGWELMQYKQNPVILWGHDGTNIPPIGRSTNVRRGTGPGGRPALLSSIEFAPKEANPFAETVYQLAKGGFVNAVSVGFQPVANEDISEKERAALGMPKYGVLYTKANLLEISVVSVPANPAALVTGTKSLVDGGVLSDKQIERFIKEVPLSAEDAYKRLKARLRSFVDMGAMNTEENSPEPKQVEQSADIPAESEPAEVAEEAPEQVEAEPSESKAEEAPEKKMHSAVAEAIGHIKMAMTALTDMGEGGYDEQEESRSLDSADRRRSDFDARLIEAQSEQARALSTLVDSISDLTRRIHSLSDVDGGTFESVPEAKASEAKEEIPDEALRNATRAFLQRINQLTPKRTF